VSGRRFYPRFLSLLPRVGQMRISRDVAVQTGSAPGELAIFSDSPGVVDAEFTLALVSSAGEIDVRVRVLDSRPHMDGDVLRHRVRLQLLSTDPPPQHDNDRSTEQ
jgi:hypothetical protein